jgi:hypothetical protein
MLVEKVDAMLRKGIDPREVRRKAFERVIMEWADD